jgi:Zn finger protein HypA/HybF involved in hydrogenase expression
MKKKEMKFETMLSTVWCWDCNKPLKKGMKTDNDCDCKKTMSKNKGVA